MGHKGLNSPAKVQSPLETTAAKRGETPRIEKLAFGASSIVEQPSLGFPATANTLSPFWGNDGPKRAARD